MAEEEEIDVGLEALLYLSDNPHSTTSDIAKAIYDLDGDVDELRKKDNKVRYHLENKYDLVVNSEKKDGTKHYSIDEERFYYGAGKIDIVTPDGDDISIGLGRCLLIQDDEGRPTVISLSSSMENNK